MGYFSGNGADSNGNPRVCLLGGHAAAGAFAELLAEPRSRARQARA